MRHRSGASRRGSRRARGEPGGDAYRHPPVAGRGGRRGRVRGLSARGDRAGRGHAHRAAAGLLAARPGVLRRAARAAPASPGSAGLHHRGRCRRPASRPVAESARDRTRPRRRLRLHAARARRTACGGRRDAGRRGTAGRVRSAGRGPLLAGREPDGDGDGGAAAGGADRARGADRRAYLAAVEERARRAEESRELEARRRVAEERVRIARELHDLVAHQITPANAQATVAAHFFDSRPEQTRVSLRDLVETTGHALDELRATVGLLWQTGDTAAPDGPAPGLDRLPDLLESFRRAGLEVSVREEGAARAPAGRGPHGVPDRAGGSDQRDQARGGPWRPGGTRPGRRAADRHRLRRRGRCGRAARPVGPAARVRADRHAGARRRGGRGADGGSAPGGGLPGDRPAAPAARTGKRRRPTRKDGRHDAGSAARRRPGGGAAGPRTTAARTPPAPRDPAVHGETTAAHEGRTA
ncbi:hypothetical protein STREPTOSP366_41740 [Streptomyces variabilis]